MSTYKLIYFNNRGRAEVIRYLFALADVDYEDVRFEKEGWPEWKEKSVFGQVPMLDIDGRLFCQSHSIEKYLARKFGFSGKTDLDHLKADMVIDCIGDFLKPLMAIFTESNEDKKTELKKTFVDEQLPKYLTNFTKLLEGDGHFVGDELTVADVAFYYYSDWIDLITGCKFDFTKWPKLNSVRLGVESNPKIAAWNAKRPVTLH